MGSPESRRLSGVESSKAVVRATDQQSSRKFM